MNHFWKSWRLAFAYCTKIPLLLAILHSGIAKATVDDTDPRAFHPLYLGISWSETFPVSNSENLYSRGGGHPSVSYRFFMHDKWLVSVSGGFKIFADHMGAEVPYFSLTQQSAYLYRLYFPTYVAIGAQAMYLIATEKANLPYQKNRDIEPQVGAGVTFGLIYRQSDTLLMTVELSRWRGTANPDLHALEISAGISYSLNGF